jgi:Tol biopolymer transport system component
MNLAPGLRLGPYEIVAPIGAGGMGEVYRARDTRLDRTVAIKVLPAALAQSTQLKLRFEREAKAISALAHPHICTLHDVGSHDGIEFLVMEHLEGESLADRLSRGPLPVEDAIRYAIQIADALDKAHRRGIIHRDLKPGNVMITRTGAKLLDFGLARSVDTEAVSPDSATIAHKPITEEGTIVGTVQYMAPEQLESRPADARTDIFAFGAVLYEMLTGRRAFGGKSRASVIASILAAEPQPLSAAQPATPPALERVIRICLEKDPDDRWQSAHDVRLELEGLTLAEAKRERTRSSLWGWVAAALIAAAAVGWWALDRSNHERAPGVRFEVHPAAGTRFNPVDGPVVVSPDGRSIAFRVADGGERELYALRRLGSTRLEPLRGTEGAFDAFWSPDGRQLAFFADGKLKRLDLASAVVSTIASVSDARGGTWAGDTILFAPVPLGPLMKIPATGGTPVPAMKLDAARKEIGQWRPFFLPDGKRFLYMSLSAEEQQAGVYLGSLESNEVHRVLDVSVPTAYHTSGHLLFVNDFTLYAQPFDERKARTTGPAVVVANGVEYTDQYASAGYSVGGSTVAWHSRGLSDRIPLERVTLDGKATSLGVTGNNVDLSDDGRHLAAMRTDGTLRNIDIWTLDLQRNVSSRITYEPSVDIGPVWSPDGKRIAYTSFTQNGTILYVRPAGGGGSAEEIMRNPLSLEVVDWSPDGRTLLAESGSDDLRLNLDAIDLQTRKSTHVAATPFQESSGRFSPDGKWIAYESDESGRSEIYVLAFPPDGSRVQVSTSGAFAPRWSSDDRTLFYVDRDRMLHSVEVAHGSSGIEIGQPRKLVRIDTVDYVVTPDGKSVIASRQTAATPQPITIVTNWKPQ